MAFEGYSLYPPLTVRDNIAFALLRDRMPKAEVASRVGEIAKLLEIEDVLDRYPLTSPPASSSAPPSPAPSCDGRTYTFSTSQCPSSSRACAPSCGRGSRTG